MRIVLLWHTLRVIVKRFNENIFEKIFQINFIARFFRSFGQKTNKKRTLNCGRSYKGILIYNKSVAHYTSL